MFSLTNDVGFFLLLRTFVVFERGIENIVPCIMVCPELLTLLSEQLLPRFSLVSEGHSDKGNDILEVESKERHEYTFDVKRIILRLVVKNGPGGS